jgi:hypothetical protein
MPIKEATSTWLSFRDSISLFTCTASTVLVVVPWASLGIALAGGFRGVSATLRGSDIWPLNAYACFKLGTWHALYLVHNLKYTRPGILVERLRFMFALN